MAGHVLRTLTEEDFTSFYEAAVEVANSCDISIGAAEKALREALQDGEVRSWEAPYDDEHHQPFPIEFWKRAPVGLRPLPTAVPANSFPLPDAPDDRIAIVIMVNREDLRYWLNGQVPPLTQDQARPRDAAIVKRLKAGERPGQTIGWKVFCDGVRKDCKALATERGFSDETIETVAKKLGRTLGRFG